MALMIPRSFGRAGILSSKQLEFGKRRTRHESFIGEQFDASRMIDRDQLGLIDKQYFFQLIVHAQRVLSILQFKREPVILTYSSVSGVLYFPGANR